MADRFLEAGRVINTHGVGGAVKIEPWTNLPEDFQKITALNIHERTYRVLSSSVHKGQILANLEGVETLDAAIALKNKVVLANRNEIPLPEGEHFIADIIGLTAKDSSTGGILGRISDVLQLPAHNVYVIKEDDGTEHLIPAVPAFVAETNPAEGFVAFRLIEGM